MPGARCWSRPGHRTLTQADKNTRLVCVVAIARELAGFIWDIVCQEMAIMKMAAR